MRTIVDLPDEQIKALSEICKQNQLSRAELLRRAIAEYLARHQPKHGDAAFGLWREHKEDGLAYQDRIRSEWDE